MTTKNNYRDYVKDKNVIKEYIDYQNKYKRLERVTR